MVKGKRFRQRGIGLLPLVVLAALICFVALVVVKLAPVYMENFTVRSSLESLDKEPELARLGRTGVRKKLDRSFQINDITSVPPKAIEVKTKPGFVHVRIKYEVRVPLVANLDIVAKFDDTFEASRN